jgi:hypothetical protein
MPVRKIGEPQREIEFEPFPQTEPLQEPAAPTPVREPEKVPV